MRGPGDPLGVGVGDERDDGERREGRGERVECGGRGEEDGERGERVAVRGLRASISRSMIRFTAIAKVRPATIATVTSARSAQRTSGNIAVSAAT